MRPRSETRGPPVPPPTATHTQGPHLRQLAFAEICDKLVTENVFSQYVYKTLPTCNHLWVFKKTFCAQSALSGERRPWRREP